MWNHRIICRELENERVFNIHEVYYEDDEIIGWTEEPVHPQGETPKELREELKMFQRAFDKPILIEKDNKLIEHVSTTK